LPVVEQYFSNGAGAIALLIEAIAVLTIALGSLRAAYHLLLSLFAQTTLKDRKRIWVNYATWLLLGLEFELAADVIRSVVAPTWADIGQLAAIATIRTLLNFFLARDIEEFSDPPSGVAVSG
jgi:uncharacterized membrane protein